MAPFKQSVATQPHHQLSKLDQRDGNFWRSIAGRFFTDTRFQMIDCPFNTHHERLNCALCHFGVDKAKSHIGYMHAFRLRVSSNLQQTKNDSAKSQKRRLIPCNERRSIRKQTCYQWSFSLSNFYGVEHDCPQYYGLFRDF